jgi:S1-C subfamily serine protease
MVKFNKMDPKNAPGQVMVKKFPASGDGKIGKIITDLIDLGLVLEEKDGGIYVADVITEMASVFDGNHPESGDRLIKIQDIGISSAENLTQVYGKIKEGDKASLTILRDGNEVALQFVKAKAGKDGGPIKIIQKQGQ